MKINLIHNVNQNNYSIVRHRNTVPNNLIEEPTEIKQQVYATNVCFKGGIPLTQVINDYKWFINNDRLPAINSLLRINVPKENFESLLKYIFSNKETSFELLDSIVNQPREINKFYTEIQKRIPSGSIFNSIYNMKNPIRNCYKEYITYRYDNASSTSELLKIRPDWSERALFAKHRQLYGNDNFFLGEIPDSIGKENFSTIVKYLNKHMQYGYKQYQEINDLNINGKNFKFKTIIDGKSDKNVFEIQIDNDKKYIIKIASKCKASLDKEFSLGTCCKIDHYLTENNCRNSAPLKYYNHTENVAIYDYINHERIPRSVTNIQEVSRKMPDFYALGLHACDTIGENNFFKLDTRQNALKNSYKFNIGAEAEELVTVDNDHVTYTSVFNPSIDGFHKDLPNALVGMFF